MSRVGKNPVAIPSGVTVTVDGAEISVKGSKGQLSYTSLPEQVSVSVEDNQVVIAPAESARNTAMWGTTRAVVANMVTGVSEGFTKTLEMTGVGYRAQMKGKTLNLALGFSHEIDFEPPEGIEIKTPSQTSVEITGIDKQKVGQVAAVIRGYRPPEPYKGKGVRYAGEYILRKEGKKK